MKVVIWQLVKGDTQTASLLSYEDRKELGMILSLSQTIGRCKPYQEHLKECKDPFEGVENNRLNIYEGKVEALIN